MTYLEWKPLSCLKGKGVKGRGMFSFVKSNTFFSDHWSPYSVFQSATGAPTLAQRALRTAARLGLTAPAAHAGHESQPRGRAQPQSTRLGDAGGVAPSAQSADISTRGRHQWDAGACAARPAQQRYTVYGTPRHQVLLSIVL